VGGSSIRELFGLDKGIYGGCADLERVLIFVQAGSVDLGLGLKLGVRHGDCQGLTSREGGGGA
jgi:hypothetical protein